MSTHPKHILIIDDHRLVADGLSLILSQTSSDLNITTANSVRSVLQDEQNIMQQDVILVDLHMPAIDGFGFLAALKERKISVPVIVVSAVENRQDIERVLREGAMGFVPKNAPSNEMTKAIRAVLDGKRFVPEHLTGAIDWRLDPKDGDTRSSDDAGQRNDIDLEAIRPRQLEVLKLMHAGYSNADIGTVLGLSESTVKTHVSTLFKALNVKNRTACVRAATALKLFN